MDGRLSNVSAFVRFTNLHEVDVPMYDLSELEDEEMRVAAMQLFCNKDSDGNLVRHLTIDGERGIGKTTLAKRVMFFAIDRKRCTGGAIFVDLRTAETCEHVLKAIHEAILMCNLQPLDEQTEAVLSVSDLIALLESQEPLKKRKVREQIDQERRIILCLSKVDKIVEDIEQRDQLTELINEFKDKCPRMYILVTAVDFHEG